MRLSTEFAALLRYWKPDLGAFEKLRKANTSFAISVRPSTRNSSDPNGRILMKIDI
jgi:hypothetical protein